MNQIVVLVNPPVFKPGEPSTALAKLGAFLSQHQIENYQFDANIDGFHYLLGDNDNVNTLQNFPTFQKLDIYKRTVRSLQKQLNDLAEPFDAKLSLTDFKQKVFLPVQSAGLLAAAQNPHKNPFYDYYVTELLPQIKQIEPTVIGLSIGFLSQAVCAFALIGLLKKHFPKTKIIIGGGLVSTWKSHPSWTEPFTDLVDFCVAGPGEDFFREYCNLPETCDTVLPDFTTTRFDQYFSPTAILPYNAATGCYWRKCNFCPEKAEKNKYQPIHAELAVQQISSLVKQNDLHLVHFLDNALSKPLLQKMIENPLPAPWYGYVRFIDKLTDVEYCKALRHSGCVMLKLGLESGDQTVLNHMGKGINITKASKILHNLKSVGIATFVYVLFGTPYETINEARSTVNFVADHADCIDFINPAIFNLPIFSLDAQDLQTRYFYEGDLTMYLDFDHPKGWNRGKVRRFLAQEFKKNPKVGKILNTNPPALTSNHAPFFTQGFTEYFENREVHVE